MTDRFPACLPHVLKYEGGYVNHPKDPGGETNFGITRRVYDAYRLEHDKAVQSVKKITRAEVSDIYRSQYWDAVRCGELPPGIDLFVFDFAVNSGPGRATRHLQQALGVTADSAMGKATLAAAREAAERDDEPLVINRMAASRLKFLRGLGTWSTFGKGWTSRVEAVTAASNRAVVHAENVSTITPLLYQPAKARDAKPADAEPAQQAEASGKWGFISTGAAGVLYTVKDWTYQVREMLGDIVADHTLQLALGGAATGAIGFGLWKIWRGWDRAHQSKTAEMKPPQATEEEMEEKEAE